MRIANDPRGDAQAQHPYRYSPKVHDVRHSLSTRLGESVFLPGTYDGSTVVGRTEFTIKLRAGSLGVPIEVLEHLRAPIGAFGNVDYLARGHRLGSFHLRCDRLFH